MKNLKAYLGILVMFLLVLSSCGKENISTNIQDAYQSGDMIEEIATYAEFEELNEQMEIDGYQPITITEATNIEDLSIVEKGCSPCYPWLSNISVYNLGGNNRGFSVNGGRHHPCSYEIDWYVAGSGTIINWQSGGFASMTFPGPGTYHICAVLTSSNGETTCYAFSDIEVSI